MQGLSQAPASVCGENCEFDDVEVAANPLRGDRLWKRVTQQIRPVLATLTGYPQAYPVTLSSSCVSTSRCPWLFACFSKRSKYHVS
jgi:hypothetical protein